NTINVTATDIAGNTSVDSIGITYDPLPPTVTITGPTTAATYNTSATSITLSGTASDTLTSVTQVNWAVAGGPSGGATGTTNWTTPLITLASGTNTITITALDAAGNPATDQITVVSDNIQPTIDITSPTSNPTWVMNSSSINIGGSANDTGGSGLTTVTWTNAATGGNGTATGTTGWSVNSIGLFVGSNLITVTATDGANNQKTDQITVTY